MGIKELLRFVQLRKLNIHKEDFLLGVNESSDISDFQENFELSYQINRHPPSPLKQK